MVKVTINGTEYEYRFDLGAQLVYEQLTGNMREDLKTASVASACMHYACLAADETFTMSLAQFVRHIDSQEVIKALNDAFAAEQNRWIGRNASADDEEGVSPRKAKKKSNHCRTL